MPELDRMYKERKDQGLAVFGLSSEDVELQRRYRQLVPVTYPLLTVSGQVPICTAISHVTRQAS